MKQAAKIAAEVLYKLAAEAGAEEDIRMQMNVLAKCLSENPVYAALICAPNIPFGERTGLIEQLAEQGLHPCIENLLKMLAQQRTAGEFQEICRWYEEIADEARGIAPADVVLAFGIDEEMQKRLQLKLERMCGRRVKMNVRMEKDIIGGFRIDMDGKSYDCSIKTQLNALADRLSAAEDGNE